jgi:hypothetical protein
MELSLPVVAIQEPKVLNIARLDGPKNNWYIVLTE